MDTRRKELRELSGGHPNDRRFVWYALGGTDLDPASVTALTGITPDLVVRPGDARPRGGSLYAESIWRIESGLEQNEEFHDHLDALLARMRPAWPAFVDLGRRYEAEIEAAINCSEAQGPLVQVLPDVSAALNELNATLGFDLYSLSADGEEDQT